MQRVSKVGLSQNGSQQSFIVRVTGPSFSVSQSNLEQVKQYIAGQKEHHHKIGFQDELRALLRKHEIEWDEKHVWD